VVFKKPLYKGLLIVALICFAASAAFAERNTETDPYAPVLKYPAANEPTEAEKHDREVLLARILEQPIRPVGYGIGRTAEWAERTHLEDKLTWAYTELTSHGIYPQLRRPPADSFFAPMGLGVRIQIEKLLNIEESLVTVNATGGWAPNIHYAGTVVDLGGNYKIQPPSKSYYHNGSVQYRRNSAENFYGIGQHTSLGERSSYQSEEIWLEGGIGYDLNESNELREAVVYQRMNIGNGNRERIGKIKEHFPTGIPGIDGGDLIGIVSKWMHDNRDHKTDPKKGGYQDLEFSYFHDTDGKNFQYLKMAGSAAHFFPIFSDRRVLALRIGVEKNQELGGGGIPFYNFARLGGSSIRDGSELLRSYAYNRYFDEGLIVANTEYRYNIYEYGNFAGDAIALFDIGEVFEEIHDFGFDELKFSYGGGLNLKYKRHTILFFSLARGNEGWAARVHTHTSF